MDESSLPELTSEEELQIEKGLHALNRSHRKPMPTIQMESAPVVQPDTLKEMPKEVRKGDSSQRPNNQRRSVLEGVNIPRENLTEAEYQQLKTIQQNAPTSEELKRINPQEMLKEMQLSKDDLSFMARELNAAQSPTRDDPFSRLERLITKDDSIMKLLDQWMMDVEKAVGKSVNNPLALSEEELKKIPPAPEKLQDVVKYMFSSGK